MKRNKKQSWRGMQSVMDMRVPVKFRPSPVKAKRVKRMDLQREASVEESEWLLKWYPDEVRKMVEVQQARAAAGQ